MSQKLRTFRARVALRPRCGELDLVIWLVAMWVVVVALWGVIEPGVSGETIGRLARWLRVPWHAGAEHPFDWAED